MCPLRLILIFLSATLASFFILRNLNSKSEPTDAEPFQDSGSTSSLPPSKKVMNAIGSGFWICVDMASGRYLWRNLASSKPKQS